MARKVLFGLYEDGAYVLRQLDCPEEGQVYRVIEPGTVISVGNSIGGWYARPISYAGQAMISLVRISGRQKGLPLEEIRRETRGEKGRVLKPGEIGLWATTSGSARRGLIHRYTPVNEEKDPIIGVLREFQIPVSALKRVETGMIIEDENVFYDHSHCASRRVSTRWEHNGEETCGEEVYTSEPRGYFNGGGYRPLRIDGATCAVKTWRQRALGGALERGVSEIRLTPEASAEDLRKILSEIW